MATRKPELSEVRNPAQTMRRRMADAEEEMEPAKDKEAGEVPPATSMSQSDFFKARTPQERANQQKMLANKLRSRGY